VTDFWSGKRVLVTGASGFAGSHLVERLLGAGARVTASASTVAALIPRGLDGEHWSRVRDGGTATRSFLHVDDVVRGLMAPAERSPSPHAANLATTTRSPSEISPGCER
jgi:nucleoside-diphosphate-sugar epimerase